MNIPFVYRPIFIFIRVSCHDKPAYTSSQVFRLLSRAIDRPLFGIVYPRGYNNIMIFYNVIRTCIAERGPPEFPLYPYRRWKRIQPVVGRSVFYKLGLLDRKILE